jgi:hypothetical protein
MTKIKAIETNFNLGIVRIQQLRNNSPELVPIHSLPNELLSTIFLCGHEAPTFPAKAGPYFQDIVSQVCTLWRTVSIQTTRLWSNIEGGSSKSPLRTSRLLERSGTSPLSLYLYSPYATISGRKSLDMALVHFQRWTHLFVESLLYIDLAHVSYFLEELSSQQSLKSIDMSLRNMETGPPLDLFLNTCLDKFIGLTDLHLQSVVFATPLRCDPFLWHCLTVLRPEDVTLSPGQLGSLIQQCSNLIVLALVKTGFERNVDTGPQLFTLPLLRHLTIQHYNCLSLPFFSNAALPSLESLTFIHNFSSMTNLIVVEFLSGTTLTQHCGIHLTDAMKRGSLPMSSIEGVRHIS